MTNFLSGVGIGPGDPGWLTIRAVEVIRSADVLVLVKGERSDHSIARQIIAPHLREGQEELLLSLPMTNDTPLAMAAREKAYALVLAQLDRGLNVVMPVLGDPLLYGSFNYLFERVHTSRPDIKVEIVPGITALAAAAARGQQILVQGEERLAVLPAVYEADREFLCQVFQQFDTVVLLKVNHCFEMIVDLLIQFNLETSALYVERVGLLGERLSRDLSLLRGQTLPYLSLLIVHNSEARLRRNDLKCSKKG